MPLEMHKVKIVQALQLLDVDDRLKAITVAGNNTFLLSNKDVFLDMLTDSGVNAMSDEMQSSMFIADDSYAGSVTYERLSKKIAELFGMEYFLPAHQGRACEHILCKHFVQKGDVIPMNYRFDSIKEHIKLVGAEYKEFVTDEAYKTCSDAEFKGNFDVEKFRIFVEKNKNRIPFVRIEAGTNLIGGQPVSYSNIKNVSEICKENELLVVLDASLLQDNLYFIKTREQSCMNKTIKNITREIADMVDIIYFSARKLGFARGGGICVRDIKLFAQLRKYITLYEGFTTYGGMSVREMEAITIGLEETMNIDVIRQAPEFINYMASELSIDSIPIVTPPGGLGLHLDAKAFLPEISQSQYPAAVLASAIYIVSGVRVMERGTVSAGRDETGKDNLSKLELVRIALPRRVFTLSQINYVVDRIRWLYDNRTLLGGLRFEYEPSEQRLYFGKLAPTSDWQNELVEKFKIDFTDSL